AQGRGARHPRPGAPRARGRDDLGAQGLGGHDRCAGHARPAEQAMRARSERQDDELALVLAVGPELGHAVRELAFGEEGERFVRRFPASAPFARRAALRFEACVPALVRQAAGVEPVPWGRALESVIDRTRESGADWWLTGSAAL